MQVLYFFAFFQTLAVPFVKTSIDFLSVQLCQFLQIILNDVIIHQKSFPKWQQPLLRPLDAQYLAIHPLPPRIVPLLELYFLLKVDVEQLMVDSLASVVDQISNRDETGLVEVVTEATCHHCPVAVVEGLAEELLAVLLELLSFHEICNQFALQLQTLYPHMDDLLDHRFVQSLQLLVLPIHGCLWLGDGLQVGPPLALLEVELMVHEENAEDIELCIFCGLVIEEIVVGQEELLESWIVVASCDCEDEMGGNCNDECLWREGLVGGDTLNTVDVCWNGQVRMDFAALCDHPLAESRYLLTLLHRLLIYNREKRESMDFGYTMREVGIGGC